MSATPEESCGQLVPFLLTPECERVQRELLDLSGALGAAAIEEYPDLATSFRDAAEQFRRHLREHVADVENGNGLYAAIVQSAPGLAPQVQCLSREHAALEGAVEALAALLERFDPDDAGAARRVREAAAALGALVRRHQDSARALAGSVCCGRRGSACDQ